ncbi:TPA: VRR-NUC domain-containing protein [Vibrio campbellii]
MSCEHRQVSCLNQYELIRKYICEECSEIMMCECDKNHGERYLTHQLDQACILETQERVPVTIGFQKRICNECKGLPLENAPVSSSPGRTSQLHRYYWREIAFKTTERFYQLHPELWTGEGCFSEFEHEDLRKEVEKAVIQEIKELHKTAPKYTYVNMLSEPELIKKYAITKHEIKAKHRRSSNDNRVRFEIDGHLLTVEEFALNHYEKTGFYGLETESIPFHVIFGAYMAPFIQDASDEKCKLVQFGSRTYFDMGVAELPIFSRLPSDFGTEGYYERRGDLVESYIESLTINSESFDEYLLCSSDFREYLWAHRQADIELAREIIVLLGENGIKKVLSYLSRAYWTNFCGWPDLLLSNGDKVKFVEVKSSNDKLSDDQKNWVEGNFKYLGFSFELFKVCKA